MPIGWETSIKNRRELPLQVAPKLNAIFEMHRFPKLQQGGTARQGLPDLALWFRILLNANALDSGLIAVPVSP